MSHLNSHQFTIQKVESPGCRCGNRNEDTNHFVLKCPMYESLRNTMFSRLSRKLKTDFRQISPKRQLAILLHGAGLSSGDGSAVALYFQDFLQGSKRFPRL